MNAHRRQASLARRLLTRDEQTALAQKRPWITYVDLALIHATLIAAFVLLAIAPSLIAKVIALLMIGTRQYALFIIGHDGMHRSLHPSRTINDRISRWLIFAPMGMSLDDGRGSHLNHHRLLGFESDPDRYLHGAENKATALSFLLFLTGLTTFPKTVWKVTPFGKRRSSAATLPEQGGKLSAFIASRMPVAVVQMAIIAAIAMSPLSIWYYPLFWILPIYLFVFVPDEIRAFCDHAHPVVPDRAVDEKRLITYVPPAWERLLFSPNHMNYHAEHHLWPFIPYYHLPLAHKLAISRAGDRIIVRKSYVRFLWQYFRSLPLRSTARATVESKTHRHAPTAVGSPA